MTKIKMQMDMVLVKVIEPLTAKPGDHLIVSPTGHCLGVYTGRVEATAAAMEQPKDVKKVLAGQKGGVMKAAAAATDSTGKGRWRSREEREELERKAIKLIRDNPGINSSALMDKLGLKGKARTSFRITTDNLEKQKLIFVKKMGTGQVSQFYASSEKAAVA